jgi:lantibiotic biosynthesis protein
MGAMTTPSSSWKPLLTGDLAAQVSRTVEEIARALDHLSSADAPEQRHASLAGGDAGEALLHAYLFFHSGDEQRAERAATLLETAVEALASTVMMPGLYSGFAGIAWAVEHLQSRLFAADPDDDSAEDANHEIDEALLSFLGSLQGNEEYDLISGFAGLGVYGRERLARPSGAAVLEGVVDRLAAQAETGPAGTTWFTAPERLPDWQREIHPEGLYNLGAAHGMPAVIALLAVACSAGVAAERARPLLDGAVRWLLANRRPPGSGSCFSSFAGEDAPPSRLAWCYGDAGVAATLLVAARAVGEAAWEREALDIARAAAARPTADAGVRDPGVCHGAAGLAHLFNRFWQASGEETFAAAARFWIGRTLELRVPGEEIAGFRAWRAQPSPQGEWVAEPGFLEGATGIGLVLLAAVSTVEPEWDRILLVS